MQSMFLQPPQAGDPSGTSVPLFSIQAVACTCRRPTFRSIGWAAARVCGGVGEWEREIWERTQSGASSGGKPITPISPQSVATTAFSPTGPHDRSVSSSHCNNGSDSEHFNAPALALEHHHHHQYQHHHHHHHHQYQHQPQDHHHRHHK